MDYRHSGDKRKNIPPAKMAGEGVIPAVKKARYYFSPHLSPELRFDPTGNADQVSAVKEKAAAYLTDKEREVLHSALAQQQPWLEWTGKQEQYNRGWFDVDPVALHIHERVSSQAIIRAAMREDLQRDLFADPELEYQKAVQFYKHDVDWANRLILGDSLQVMSSLSRRENLAGKVQMIYIDPPYGIKFGSNFQPIVGKRDVRDKPDDLTREPETVKAYRDTWTLGVHSYLTYLRDRLIVARELLNDTGSVFIQISDDNAHRIRAILDDVFGEENFCAEVAFRKTSGIDSALLASSKDWLLWYAKDKSRIKYRRLFKDKVVGEAGAEQFDWFECANGTIRKGNSEEISRGLLQKDGRLFAHNDPTAVGNATTTYFTMQYAGRSFSIPANRRWRTPIEGMNRIVAAERFMIVGDSLRYKRYLSDHPVFAITDWWDDTGISGFGDKKSYVVQTASKVIERCMMMTTDPGDLVLDPTSGSATTAYVAEQWGRRWITIDTSRVAVAIARQRLLTAKYEFYKFRADSKGVAGGFRNKKVPHITLKSIAQNQNLDPICFKHTPFLSKALEACNNALGVVSDTCRNKLKQKLQAKQVAEGKRNITVADERRWDLPKKFEQWTVPFDVDSEWPKDLQEAVTAYRKKWREKMNEVNACIEANAEQEELVDQPEVVKNILRVSGPFTVEGVRPEELSMSEDGSLFDPTQNDWESESLLVESKNITAYLTRMTELIRKDGVTFPNNKHQKFHRVEALFQDKTGSELHAEAIWEGSNEKEANNVVISFGPQYGPVTAAQVEELIRSSRRYDELVVAAFSFDAAATEIIQASQHPKLKIHMAHIRPDVSPGMDGLLKDTPNSQLFTVFGQPEIEVKTHKDGTVQVELCGVDIYDPLKGEVISSGAEKVAAWLLDGDYDGRCFCITQAFFPDQDSWEKIAKALGSTADIDAFTSFKGTRSIPFNPGKHNRIAVKVIDPRGNEVMTIEKLGEA